MYFLPFEHQSTNTSTGANGGVVGKVPSVFSEGRLPGLVAMFLPAGATPHHHHQSAWLGGLQAEVAGKPQGKQQAGFPAPPRVLRACACLDLQWFQWPPANLPPNAGGRCAGT